MRLVKSLIPLVLFVAFALSACNTIENRRSLYRNTKVHGPYTRQLEEGTWGRPKSVSEEYAEQQKIKNGPKLIPGATKPASSSPSTGTQPTPEATLPQ